METDLAEDDAFGVDDVDAGEQFGFVLDGAEGFDGFADGEVFFYGGEGGGHAAAGGVFGEAEEIACGFAAAFGEEVEGVAAESAGHFLEEVDEDIVGEVVEDAGEIVVRHGSEDFDGVGAWELWEEEREEVARQVLNHGGAFFFREGLVGGGEVSWVGFFEEGGEGVPLLGSDHGCAAVCDAGFSVFLVVHGRGG